MEEQEVPTEHLHEEINERVEHSRERWTLGVALSSALLAGFAAVAALMAGHYANEAMIHQIQSSDQWSYYQSKGIKENEIANKIEILEALGKPVMDSDRAKIAEYLKKREEIEKAAKALELRGRHLMHTYQKLASSVTLFQVAISLGAISVLMKRRAFWYASLVSGAVGVACMVQALVTSGSQ
jgi:hypothetical protein